MAGTFAGLSLPITVAVIAARTASCTVTSHLLHACWSLMASISLSGFSGIVASVLAPKARRGPALARREQDQNGGSEEAPDSQVCRPCTVCGQPGACTRGRFGRYTQAFPRGLDSLPSTA